MESQLDLGQTSTARQAIERVKGAAEGLDRRARPVETIVRALLLFCGVVSIFTTIGIVLVLGVDAFGFFGSRAWVLAKAPVADPEPSAVLAETVTTGDRTLRLTFEGDRVPFNNNQFIQIGDETLRVVDRGRQTVDVQRGQDGTEAAEHSTEALVFGMRDNQVKTLNSLSPDAEDTILYIGDTFAREFRVGSDILMSTEVMQIVEIRTDVEFEGQAVDALVVDRAQDGTTLHDHDADDETIEIADDVTLVEYLTTTIWQPQVGNFGIWPLAMATIVISVIAMLVSIPLGLGAAIYLSEYAPGNVRQTLKPILEILAGIPTVVYGFFALTFVTPGLQSIFGQQVQFYNMLSAGLVVGILIIPYISSVCEDALSAVPRALREASYGLGATRLETTVKVVLPSAISGILAAFILGASRAVGETMIVALAAGAGPNFTFNVFEGAETMTGHIARISSGDLSYGSIDYNSIFAIGLTLFLMTLSLNLFSSYVKSRLEERY
ncbi:MAG: hypothetical protein OHK0046_09170 [Anaerolineae bacterium]